MTGSLLEICRPVFAAADIDKLLPFLLDLIIQETQAERCRIVLDNEAGKTLFNRGRKKGAAEDDTSDTKVSRKIVSLVKASNEVFISENAMIDPRLEDSDQIYITVVQQGLLSVACAPLRDQGRTFGVVYIDNRGQQAVFNEQTGELLSGLAELMSEPLRKSLYNTLRQRKTTELLQQHIQHLTEEVEKLWGYGELIGTSPAMKKVYAQIDKIKDLEVKVLITGESGTGKELVARALHQKSSRANGPFIRVNCGALAETLLESELFGHEKGAFTGALKRKLGRFELAHRGTIFLDEIGDISPALQVKLLRVLQEQEFERVGGEETVKVDVRVIAATHRNLEEAVSQGQFREDLYYRLHNVPIHLPPLRERGRDIILIAEKILARYVENNKKPAMHFSEEACACLLCYAYPGNVRELDQIITNAAIFVDGQVIHPQNLPEKLWHRTAPAAAGDATIHFTMPKAGENDFYAKYLPEEFKERNFIWGLRTGAENSGSGDINHLRQELHDAIIISAQKAFGIPMKIASQAAAFAFERNFIIEKLLETKGKVIEAALRLNVDKKTLIEKMKLHDIKKEWYVD